jgi:hypothetical protein
LWRPAGKDPTSYEHTGEIVLYQHFINWGFTLPTFDFLGGHLYNYGIQIHHLNLNSILHVAIFIHLCEVFLGFEPHFNLFCYLFRLKPQPNENDIDVVRGARFQLRQKMDQNYIEYKLPSSLSRWKERWFCIGNHKPALPEWTNEGPKIVPEWKEKPS